ncbi:TetR family transcriptional regulator C-terminal domain-containing protein [Variovorax paradoxus]|uniref:TetR family transcriptional regulator C-terminal domain-containing protein n=1 Tax=Variovorax paradoxus TaxID=34073 RepID=UPI0027D7A2C8|nr:hypothetical protein [Variovorax paradoxus]
MQMVEDVGRQAGRSENAYPGPMSMSIPSSRMIGTFLASRIRGYDDQCADGSDRPVAFEPLPAFSGQGWPVPGHTGTYTDRVLRRMKSYEDGSSRARLEALLRGLLPTGSRRPPGCLLARSCAELVDLPPEGRKAATSGMSQQRHLLEDLLREAIAGGELPRGADVAALAWYFLGVSQAVLDLPQAGATRSELDRMIAVAMRAWPAAGIAPTRT